MSLREQVVDIAITGGINRKTDSRKVQPPQLYTADNAIYTTDGEIRKRYGFTALNPTILGGGAISSGIAIQNVNGELCFADGNNFYAYSQTTLNWESRGFDSPPAVIARPALAPQDKQTFFQQFGNITFADIGNYRCVVLDSPLPTGDTFGNTVEIGIWDKSKNTWLTAPYASPGTVANTISTVDCCGRPVVVAFGQYFYVFFLAAYTGGTELFAYGYYVIDSTTLAADGFVYPAPQYLNYVVDPDSVGGINNSMFIDATATATTVYAVAGMSYGTGTVLGPSTAYVFACTTLGGSGTTVFGYQAISAISGRQTITVNSNYLLFTGVYPKVTVSAMDLATFTAGTAVDPGFDPLYSRIGVSAFGPGTATAAIVACGISGTDTSVQTPGYALGTVTAPRTVSFQTATTYPWPNQPCGIYPVSKPLYDTTRNAFVIWTQSLGQTSAVYQPTLQLNNLSNNTVMARAAYDVGVAVNTGNPNTTWPYIIPGSYEFIATSGNVSTFFLIPTTPAKQIIPLNIGAFITGARPTYYDGTSIRTMGYDAYPETPVNLVGTTTGSLTNSTPYTYTVIYRQFDNAGKLLYSSPGPFITYTTTSSQYGISLIAGTTTAGFPEYNTTYTAVLYRNTAADALDFREVTTLIAPVATTSSLTYFDGASDTALSAADLPFLYAPPSGGELPNDPPPACNIAVATQQRLFVVSSENPTQLYFSKPFDPTRAPEFNADSYINIDPNTGPIVALAVLDGAVIVFKSGAIYSVTGDGPDATGNGAFNDTVKLSSDDGCISQQSVLSTAAGIFFQSLRGIQLLDRSQVVEYPGAPIEPLLAGQTVTSALLLPASSQVRFFLSNGTVLVYDYLLQRWSTFSSVNGYYAASSTLWNNSQVTLDNTNLHINVENTGFTDNGSNITLTVETPWLGYASPQSWNRLRRVFLLGHYESTTTATLSFAYDWNESYIDSVSINTGTSLINGDSVLQWRIRAPRQVMQALKLKLVDSTITGESYNLTNFGLEYSVKSGTAKLPGQKSL